ncbi:MAG: MFS transporter, partial [Candidatus Bathyarchaeota archaeon]|nr:MFS transporter [Candidatus Bathyarchaeota archaeon]
WQATGVMAFRSLGINVAMPAGRALQADLVPAKVRGKLFGRFAASFNVGMVAGALLGPWLFETFRLEEFRIQWLGGLTVKGIGIPFFVSAIMGLLSLMLLLAFVREPPRKTKVTPRAETLSAE